MQQENSARFPEIKFALLVKVINVLISGWLKSKLYKN